MKDLIKIEPSEQLRLASETTALTQAERLRDGLARSIARLDAMTVIAAACAQFPEVPPEQAIGEFQRAVNLLVCSLEKHGADLKAAFNAERERIAPVLAAATHRHFALIAHINSIDGKLRCSAASDENKRARLRSAGLTGAELDSVTAPTDNAALLAERAELQAENDALLEFIRTKEERHLPEGFADGMAKAA